MKKLRDKFEKLATGQQVSWDSKPSWLPLHHCTTLNKGPVLLTERVGFVFHSHCYISKT